MRNTRSLEQWSIISKAIDFDYKRVIDLGCGYGDILGLCRQSGAIVLGVDKYNQLNNDLPFLELDLNQFDYNQNYDVSICFSVLPYLDNPKSLLEWMKEHSDIALIECQYNGDGPGLKYINNDTAMLAWLYMAGFKSVEAIGQTFIPDRNKHRTIWMCKS